MFFLWEGFPLLLQYIHIFFSQKQADTDIDYTRKNNHRIFFNQWKGEGLQVSAVTICINIL